MSRYFSVKVLRLNIFRRWTANLVQLQRRCSKVSSPLHLYNFGRSHLWVFVSLVACIQKGQWPVNAPMRFLNCALGSFRKRVVLLWFVKGQIFLVASTGIPRFIYLQLLNRIFMISAVYVESLVYRSPIVFHWIAGERTFPISVVGNFRIFISSSKKDHFCFCWIFS